MFIFLWGQLPASRRDTTFSDCKYTMQQRTWPVATSPLLAGYLQVDLAVDAFWLQDAGMSRMACVPNPCKVKVDKISSMQLIRKKLARNLSLGRHVDWRLLIQSSTSGPGDVEVGL